MKISIITATYNRADTIRDTIESILSQTYQDWEHVVIDGASKDNTLAILEEFKDRYKGRLKLLSEPDKGIYDAMNKGLALASGDVIGILNSDDFFANDMVLESINDAFADSSIDAVHSDIDVVDFNDTTNVIRHRNGKGFSKRQMNMGFMPCHPTYYAKKSVYKSTGKFDTSYKIAADFDNLYKAIHNNKIKLTYIPGTQVIMRDGGASQNGWASHKRIFDEECVILKKNGIRFPAILIGMRMGYRMLRKILGLNY